MLGVTLPDRCFDTPVGDARAGLTHLITMDLHQKEIQGFFNIPVDNLRASPFLLQYIQEEVNQPAPSAFVSVLESCHVTNSTSHVSLLSADSPPPTLSLLTFDMFEWTSVDFVST